MFDESKYSIANALQSWVFSFFSSPKEAHSECNETQTFLCRSCICSRILFWHCPQTQFRDSNTQIMWNMKTQSTKHMYSQLKKLSYCQEFSPPCLQIEFHDGSRNDNKRDACLKSFGWNDFIRAVCVQTHRSKWYEWYFGKKLHLLQNLTTTN